MLNAKQTLQAILDVVERRKTIGETWEDTVNQLVAEGIGHVTKTEVELTGLQRNNGAVREQLRIVIQQRRVAQDRVFDLEREKSMLMSSCVSYDFGDTVESITAGMAAQKKDARMMHTLGARGFHTGGIVNPDRVTAEDIRDTARRNLNAAFGKMGVRMVFPIVGEMRPQDGERIANLEHMLREARETITQLQTENKESFDLCAEIGELREMLAAKDKVIVSQGKQIAHEWNAKNKAISEAQRWKQAYHDGEILAKKWESDTKYWRDAWKRAHANTETAERNVSMMRTEVDDLRCAYDTVVSNSISDRNAIERATRRVWSGWNMWNWKSKLSALRMDLPEIKK